MPEALDQGKSVLISSSENAIRGLLMHLCDIPSEQIAGVEIPTGVPLIYEPQVRRAPHAAVAAVCAVARARAPAAAVRVARGAGARAHVSASKHRASCAPRRATRFHLVPCRRLPPRPAPAQTKCLRLLDDGSGELDPLKRYNFGSNGHLLFQPSCVLPVEVEAEAELAA